MSNKTAMKGESPAERRAWAAVFRAYEGDCPLKRWMAIDQLQAVLAKKFPGRESERGSHPLVTEM